MKTIAEQTMKIEICEEINEYADEVVYEVWVNDKEEYNTWQLAGAYEFANHYYGTNFGEEK